MTKSSKIKNFASIVAVILFLIYVGFWGVYKIDILPGLNADEAWFGIKAYQFNIKGIDHLYGMNNYTGILQSLVSSFSFQIEGMSVFQLRIPGALLNLLALIIICITLLIYKRRSVLILFLLIFSQSTLYLTSQRVAWEVNTFILFFISLIILSAFKIMFDPKVFRPFWSGLFLFTNLLGSYNHIIFSSLSVAALMSVILWSFYNKSFYLKNVVFTLTVNFINVVMIFICMRHWPDILDFKKIYFLTLIVTSLLIIEVLILQRLSILIIPERVSLRINKNIIYTLLIIFFGSFITFHGMALYQVISNFKPIIHFYSYPFSSLIKLLFLFCGNIISVYLCYFILEDVQNKKDSLIAIFIIVYLGLLALYTTGCSFRYYLSIYPIISLYLAFKISKRLKRTIPLIISLIGMLLLVNISFYKIFSNPERPLKAIKIVIGNNQIETSAFFLPNKPLLEFLNQNKIDEIDYLSDRYFLEQPVLFYKLIEPWDQIHNKKAIIGYDYSKNKHNGYMLYTKE